jgi:hypothetical protein
MQSLICFCFITFLANEISSHSAPAQLDKKFTNLGTLQTTGISYFISDYTLSFSDALTECQKVFLGRLLTITSNDEDEFVRLQLQMHNFDDRTQIQTAGRYNKEYSRWEWSTTGTQIRYLNWRPNEPTQSPTRDSCILLIGSLSSYGWISRFCNNENYFICQTLR